MDLLQTMELLTPLDLAAVVLVLVIWGLVGWWIEHPTANYLSVTVLMSAQRRDWMKVFVTREPRIFDSQILASLRQGTAFFASSALISIGGVLALAGNTSPLEGVAEQVAQARVPVVVFQFKLAFVALFLASAFLRFVWSNRLFGYCAVVMAAVPNDPADPDAYPRAEKAADLNIRAALNFNRGLRAVYFALGALGWLFGAWGLMIATLLVTWVVWSREFASVARATLLDGPKP